MKPSPCLPFLAMMYLSSSLRCIDEQMLLQDTEGGSVQVNQSTIVSRSLKLGSASQVQPQKEVFVSALFALLSLLAGQYRLSIGTTVASLDHYYHHHQFWWRKDSRKHGTTVTTTHLSFVNCLYID